MHYFSKLAQANDNRCDFDTMFNEMSNEQYAMLNINAFMNLLSLKSYNVFSKKGKKDVKSFRNHRLVRS